MSRNRDKEFKATWEADDGYCGGSRSHTCRISMSDFEKEDSEKDLRELFWNQIQQDFEDKVHPVCPNEDTFVAWAKERQAEMED